MRAFQFAASVPWMIREEALRGILEIASRNNPSIAQVEAELGRELKNEHNFRVENGVAVIPVIGPIFRYADIFTQISGATSVSTLTKDLDAALSDDEVKSILLEIDSPGGEANGINEFAEKIYAARGKKPIESYVSGNGCSAAYWIASATSKITTDEMASLGSIGVAAVMQDTDEADAMEGIKNIKFVSSKSPNKRPDLNSTEGRNVIQENIDAMADVFIDKVARNRAVTAEYVVEGFNYGGVLIGQQAVDAKLADQLGSFDSALRSLQEKSGGGNNYAFAASLDQKTKETTDMSLQDKVKSEFEDAATAEITGEVPATADNTPEVPAPAATAAVATAPVAPAAQQPAVPTEFISGGAVAGTIQPVLIDGKTPTEIMAELTQLREIAAAAEKAKIEAAEAVLKVKAEQQFQTLLDANKVIPAVQENFISSYIQLSKDDEKNPVESFSRLDNFLAMFEDKAPHVMTDESVDPAATAVLLGSKQTSSNEDLLKALDAQAEAYAAKVKRIG